MVQLVLFVFLFAASVSTCSASLPAKVHQVKNAYDAQAQSLRLKQLAELATPTNTSQLTSGTSSASLVSASNTSSFTSSITVATNSLTISNTTSTATTSHAAASPPANAVTSFQIYTTDSLPTDPAPPTNCASALTATVACNSSIQLMGVNPYFDAASLASMCTSTCTTSLNSYRASVLSSCGSYQIPGPNGITYNTTLAVDTILGPYELQCLTDSASGSFCNAVLPTFGPPPAQGVLGYPKNELCTSCILGTLNRSLSNPLSYSNALYGTLQSALMECGSNFTLYNVTSPPTGPIASSGSSSNNTGPTFSASCALTGRNITTTGNATCQSLAAQYSVGWPDIQGNNPILQFINCTSGIAPGTQLCLPQSCTTYVPQANQTCQDVVDAVNSGGLAGSGQTLTTVQLSSLNPALGASCEGISNFYGYNICISPHGGYPNVGATSGIVIPSATPTAQVPPPGPTAPGTTSACGAWYGVQPNDFCQKVAINNSITLDEFLLLNPEVNSNCTNLWANYYYCVAPFPPLVASGPGSSTTIAPNATGIVFTTLSFSPATPTTAFPLPTDAGLPVPPNVADGTITNGCNYYYTVQPGDNCTSVEAMFNITDEDFTSWNDNFDTPCPTLIANTSVCVVVMNQTATIPPTPTNAAPGSAPSGCAIWYTIVANDNCGTVAAKFDLTSADFLALNPELNSGCTNLDLGEAYCVKAAPGTPTTTVSSPSSTPTNINPGSWTNCTTYYTVQPGDSCNVIEAKYNVSYTDFLRWNPEVDVSCDNLNIAAYCVLGANPCPNVYTVMSGDFCFKIETQANITEAQLRSLNPWLDTNCDLQIGQNLCV